MKFHTVYARKSTEAEDRQVASIDSQLQESQDRVILPKKIKIFPNGIFAESKSAKAPYVRDKFEEMMQLIEENNEIKGIVCWSLSRLSRNPVDSGKLQWMLLSGKLEEIVTPEKTYTKADEFLMAIESAQNSNFISNLRKDTVRGLDKKLSMGIFPGLAPVGYINNKHELQGQKTISLHPVTSKQWRHLCELGMTGKYSLNSLYKIAVKEKVRTNRGNIIGRSTFIESLFGKKSIFYTGKFIYKGKKYQGKHTPILTDAELQLLHDIFKKRSRPRKQKHVFEWSGLIKCGHCGFQITCDRKIKKSGLILDYCRCSQQGTAKNNCPNPTVPARQLNAQVHEFLGQMAPSEKYTQWAVESLKEIEKENREFRNDKNRRLQKELTEIQQRIDNLTDKWLSLQVDDDMYSEQLERLKIAKANTKQELDTLDKDLETWSDMAMDIFKLARKSQEIWEYGTVEDRKTLLRTVSAEMILTDGTLEISPRTPFKLIVDAKANASHELVSIELAQLPKYKGKIGDLRDHCPVWGG